MPGPDLPEIPAPLKSIAHYLKIATEHDARDPVVSYWARLYALQSGLKLSTKTTAENNFLLQLMDWLETTKKAHLDNEAITNDIAAQAHLENWALKLFLYADKNDRASNFNKSVIQSFYTAGLLYDVLTTFGELTEEATQNRKYAKWKAAYIHNCIKNGETPVPGPMKEDGDEDAIMPDDDLLLEDTVGSEPAEANDAEEENQDDVVPTGEPEGEPEGEPDTPDAAEEAPSEPDPENQADEVATGEPEAETVSPDSAEEALSESNPEDQADEVPTGEPEAETVSPDSAEEALSESNPEDQADEVPTGEPEGESASPDPAEEAPSEPEAGQADVVPASEPHGEPEGEPATPEPAEDAPSEPDPVSGNEDTEASVTPQPTPPPNTDAFGFPAVPGGSSSTGSNNSPQPSGNAPYPTLPTPATPSPYNPSPAPTSPTVPSSLPAATMPTATGGVSLSAEQQIKAGKYIKWAGSAVAFDDISTAIENLQKALHLLTTGQDS